MLVEENQVRIEKLFKIPAPELFRALSQGRLFFNCGTDHEKFENDFRVGGKYLMYVPGYAMTNVGKYLEIVPDRKLVFTWGDASGDERSDPDFPMTRVTIELFPDGNSTRLVLVHAGFKDQKTAEDHDQGWSGGLTDFGAELENGQIRMLRTFKVSREKLYAACSNPKIFFGLVAEVEKGSCDFRVGGRYSFPTERGSMEGKFEVIVPNEKIVFTWEKGPAQALLDSRVELRFEEEDDGSSSLELIHSGLKTEDLVGAHREGWNYLTNRLPEKLGA